MIINKMDSVLSILRGKVLFSVIVGVLSGLASVFLSSIFSIPFYIITFNVFDYLGYNNLIGGLAKNPGLGSYRIMQTMMQVAMLSLIYSTSGFWIMIASEVVHLTGGQDLLYYWIGNFKLETKWTWLYWTPIGWFWNKKEPIPLNIVLIQSITGVIISILIWRITL